MNGDDRWGEPTVEVRSPPQGLPVSRPEPVEVPAGQADKTDPGPARRRVDFDQVQEFVWSVVYAVLLLAGTIGGAWALTEAFAGWVGCLLLVAVGGAGTAYSLRKSAERRAERERNAMLAAGREHTRGQG